VPKASGLPVPERKDAAYGRGRDEAVSAGWVGLIARMNAFRLKRFFGIKASKAPESEEKTRPRAGWGQDSVEGVGRIVGMRVSGLQGWGRDPSSRRSFPPRR
jgi:hypothetical protein